jgi:hypothetical protein
MHAFAAAFPKLAREKTFDGARRGVFTRTLLAGLRGGAAVPAAQGVGSVVTSASLEGFLKDNMKRYFSAEELANPDLADEPVVDRGSAVITIAEFPQLPVFPVQVDLVPGETGAPLKLFDASSRELPGVPGQVPASNGASAPSLSLQLPRGLYRLEVGARQLLFEVWGLRDQGALGGPNAGNQ